MIPNASEMPAAILWRLITRLISVRPVWTCVLFKAMNPAPPKESCEAFISKNTFRRANWCGSPKVFDVAVDLRKDSETFGQWYGVDLSEDNKRQFYIPEGFAHGFYVLSDIAEFVYQVTNLYHPEDEGAIYWADPDVNVQWPLIEGVEVMLSEKDKKNPLLKDMDWRF